VASEFSNWWTVGTALANAIGVPRTTLISAVDAGHIPWRLLGSGEPEDSRMDVVWKLRRLEEWLCRQMQEDAE
jgi:hypothetical protein